jgi:hypothetical protein
MCMVFPKTNSDVENVSIMQLNHRNIEEMMKTLFCNSIVRTSELTTMKVYGIYLEGLSHNPLLPEIYCLLRQC